MNFFREMYYWNYFYNKKIKTSSFFSPLEKFPSGMFPSGIEFASFMQSLVVRLLNLLTLGALIYKIFKKIGCDILEVIMHNNVNQYCYGSLRRWHYLVEVERELKKTYLFF